MGVESGKLSEMYSVEVPGQQSGSIWHPLGGDTGVVGIGI